VIDLQIETGVSHYELMSAKTLQKGLELLLLLGERDARLGAMTLSKLLRMPRSTTYRLLRTLKDSAFVEADSSQRGTYTLGPAILRLAEAARGRISIIDCARPEMEQLQKVTSESVGLHVIRGNQSVCVARLDSSRQVKLSFQLWTGNYLHAGAPAKLLLAHAGEGRLKAVVGEVGLPALTGRTIVSPAKLERELQAIREAGFAISYGEVDADAVAVAAPILNSSGFAVAAISVAGPAARIDQGKAEAFAELVKGAASRISEEMRSRPISPGY
jgi:IclR family KDG regulon transcriptional repressor